MQTKKSLPEKKEQGVNIIDLLAYLASKWRWFLLSVVICVGVSYLKYALSPFIYYRKATVIIKDPSNKTYSSGLDRYDNLINKVNVANEILQFRSKKLMRETVQRLHADVSYRQKIKLRHLELYSLSPVKVTFLDSTPESYIALSVTPKDRQSVVLSLTGDKKGTSRRLVRPNDTVLFNRHRIVVTPTNGYDKSWYGTTVDVYKLPMETVIGQYLANFGIRQEQGESSILTLSFKDYSYRRAEDILNMLIAVYNEEAVNDKNQISINTAEFINERLVIIEKELGGVETELETFKKSNQVVDLGSSAGMYMNESHRYNTDAMELETQIRLANFIKNYLTNPANDTELIPANTGISDANVESLINQYNNIKLRRDKLIDDSSDRNPVVEELNNSLNAMKQSVIRAVDNVIVSLNVRRNDALSRERMAQSRVVAIPTKERQMLSIERQQKIKESLYLFLLNKREENALSQAMADNNARVIDGAEGSSSPISPERNRILLLGFAIGIAIPGVVFLLLLFIDTRVHSRRDFEGTVSLPFLGEIPIDKDMMRQRKKTVINKSGDDMVSSI